jgi:putative transcriptional regulator
MDYFLNNKQLNPGKGDLLISEPFLPDPNFERTVVLLCEHNEEGAFGFVLNKPSLVTMEEVLEDVSDFKEQIYVGGPVQQDTLHFIHRSSILEDKIDINDGLFWGGNFEQLMIMINTKQINTNDFRFFLGYSGWSSGQLMEELEQNSWIVYQGATPEQVFDQNPDILWKEVLNKMGGKYKMFSNYPIDPRLN